MIDLETHIVATRYDPLTGKCHYTLARDGKRWTFDIALAELEGCGPHDTRGPTAGPNDLKRRQLVLNACIVAMRGPPDAEEIQA
jgi:hypothetical protein